MTDEAAPEARVRKYLTTHGLAFTGHSHPPVYTCEEAERLVPQLDGMRTKNLFLRDRKGKRHFLVVARPDQMVDLNALSNEIGSTRLSMASSERLQKYLGITPGAVSVLALLHDEDCAVEVIVDESIWSAQRILCHPMVNTSTFALSLESLRRIFELTGHDYRILALPERESV